MPRPSNEPRTALIQGNEACAEGALLAGCRFFAGYPITPSTEVAEVLAHRLPVFDGTFIQMEDEIASLGAVIGASLAGAKAMTATSGPGFSLMQEHIGFACMAEVPCVIVNVMRLGPSTGFPTAPSQGDVQQARWGTHGDHPIIALCPSTVGECLDLTVRAFNLAEKYRTPVILLMDEQLGHMRENIILPEPGGIEVLGRAKPQVPTEWYVPYEDTPAGVPAMGVFGEGQRFHVTGLMHDPHGYPTGREDEIVALTNRLFRKIFTRLEDIQTVDAYAVDDADVVVIAYGSVARTARHAVRLARKSGIKAGLLRLVTLWPFCRAAVENLLKTCDYLVVPELNKGQISREVKRVVQGQAQVRAVNKFSGRAIRPEEILAAIAECRS
ncbi:MAG: 2-oxoacid:acceptor oxidoreductase subunit alpha [Proteobacteria bacterium]|nr:2-oxoacid:acceptor oxidoreductase subunit alpha [Pseudomonadota bacterium]